MRLPLLFLLLYLVGCAREVADVDLPYSRHQLPEPKLTYLGVGGWLVRWRGEALLFAPSFSNPAFPPLLVSAKPQRIDEFMPKAADVSVLLIGHSHYDHLIDVPWVMQKYTPRATAYGPETAGHILSAVKPPLKFVNVEPKRAAVSCASDGTRCRVAQSGTWLSSGPFRFMPLESRHAPHFLGIDLLPGAYHADLERLPRTVWGWREGTTLAWLVDLVGEDGRTVYRLHYQDSASTPPMGFPPIVLDNKRVDVEILCAASWDQVEQYPGALLRVTRPRRVALGHWEDFFGNNPRDPQVLRSQKEAQLLDEIQRRVPGIDVVVPYPLTEVGLPQPEVD
ncbi:hypothetical protein [Pseudomonas sp. DP-17]|uniref:MBL fold metallo-hydrolase n=1 Tax=Pseudomonas sp. DP-17 TaxID=1580486 RepID=UPI001EFBD6CA|nr:hypothetical protein [Pseudomonas sp. DP-17]MCG8907717.1 hypothetical protein [Pseudomonas sp. DP-17]